MIRRGAREGERRGGKKVWESGSVGERVGAGMDEGMDMEEKGGCETLG